jgi:hypothetical protein
MSDPSTHFTDMAERLKRNIPEEFQGAYVIVTPDNQVIQGAFFAPKGDPNQFWGYVSGHVQVAATESQLKAEAAEGLNRGRLR